jgi:hypothetical protein
MTYDLSPSPFLEGGSADEAEPTRSANRPANDLARLWRTSDREHRWALVENQLRAA